MDVAVPWRRLLALIEPQYHAPGSRRDWQGQAVVIRLGSGGDPQLLQQRDQMSRPGPGFRKHRVGWYITNGPHVMLGVSQGLRQTGTAKHGG